VPLTGSAEKKRAKRGTQNSALIGRDPAAMPNVVWVQEEKPLMGIDLKWPTQGKDVESSQRKKKPADEKRKRKGGKKKR